MTTTIERVGPNIAPLIGRILLALIFVIAGLGKVTGFEGTVGYIASKNVPMPELAAIAAIIAELGGGLMLVFGIKARWAAAALVIFTVFASVIFHNFWAVPPDQVQMQVTNFLKNVSMIGGLIYIIVYGSGPFSLKQ